MGHLLCEVSVLLVLAADAWSVSVVPREIVADDPDANGQRAARFLGLGYNILQADPEAVGHGGVDPGFLTTHKVVDVTSAGEETFPRHSCVTQTSTSFIYDEQSFQRKVDKDVKVEAGVSSALISARFGLSHSFSEARDQTTKEMKMTLETMSLCNLGEARMKTELNENRASQSFQAAVCSLPDTYDEKAYVDFIDHWGTSVVISVDVGIREVTKKTETFSSVFNSLQKSLGRSVSSSMSYNAGFLSVSGSIEMDMHTLEKSDKLSEAFKGVEIKKSIGTQDYPEPIAVTVQSIHSVLTPAYFGNENPAVCTSAKMSLLATKQSNLQRVLDTYPAIKGVSITDNGGKVKIPLNWPRGTYGLFKPTTGCPAGWDGSGYRHWDTEDSDAANSVTPGHHFDGSIEHNIDLKFCIKTMPVINTTTDVDWPIGEYCLLKYRDCPLGFQFGQIHWDDEDHDTQNSAGGTLPDGGYGGNTDIQFCCRTDGQSVFPIFLPTDKPFYLLQASRYGCQTVAGMQVLSEFIHWDDEDDSNADSYTGSVPLNSGDARNVHLFFCYYFK